MNEQITIFLLGVLAQAAHVGMEAPVLLQQVRVRISPDVTLPDFQRLLRDLADKGLVRKFEVTLSADRWRITDLGLDVAREKGLA